MKRLLIISSHLINPIYQKRWKELSENYPIHIRILIPERWESTYYERGREVFIGKEIREEKYEVLPVPTTNNQYWWSYKIINLRKFLYDFKPELIFVIHDEFMAQLRQTIFVRFFYSRKSRLIFFSTHAALTLRSSNDWAHKKYYYFLFKIAKWGTDAALVHYPEQIKHLRDCGYSKKILAQTQVGIDSDLFKPNPLLRARARKDYNNEDFIIGYAGRIIKEKGILDLIKAVTLSDNQWKLIIVGGGKDFNICKDYAQELGIENRVFFVGPVGPQEVPEYLNAFDCFFTGSHTTNEFVDTFPNAVAQGMACGVPCVVSDSAALPYIVGNAGIVFKEGNEQEIHDAIEKLFLSPGLRKTLGLAGIRRVKEEFSTTALADKFYKITNYFC